MPTPPTGTPPDPGARSDHALPPPAVPSWRPLRAHDGVLGGVCRGFALATGVDLTLVRLAFVAAGLTGFGVLAYLVLWMVVPQEDANVGRVLRPAPPDTAHWLRLGLLIGGLIGLVSFAWRWSFGWFDPFPWDGPSGRGPGMFLGLVLVAVGIGVIWFRRRDDLRANEWRSGRAGVAPASAGSSAAPPWPAPAAGPGSVPPLPPAPAAPGPPPPQPPARPQARSLPGGVIAMRVIAWLAVIAAILATAATGVLTFVIGAISLSLPGLALTVLVAAIIAVCFTAAVARHVWPVVLSLVLLLGAIGLTAGLARWDGEVGEQTFRPLGALEVSPSYDFAVGHFVLDLSQVALAEGTLPVSIDQGVGRLDVVLPPEAPVDARVEILGGDARVLGRVETGVGVDLVVTDDPAAGGGRFDLGIELGFGEVNVCRADPAVLVQDGC